MRFISVFIVFTLLCSAVTLLADEEELPAKALCAVCALKGENEPEKVRAHTEFEGNTYYFCATDCRMEFEADPLAYIPPKFPRPAPQFAVETLDGKEVLLSEFENKIVLLDFWATWCKPCLKTMPELQELYDEFKDRDVVVLGISIDEDQDRVKKIRKFVDKKKIAYPVYLDASEQPAWHQLKVKAIPALFLLDQDQQIVSQWLGTIEAGKIRDEVRKLVENKTE